MGILIVGEDNAKKSITETTKKSYRR